MEPPPEIQAQILVSDMSIASSKTTKKKKQAMIFFSPPELIVEKSSVGLMKRGN
ncbi:MAG: hypothetical protein WAW59_06530 [Patescibacteria group bacterium]